MAVYTLVFPFCTWKAIALRMCRRCVSASGKGRTPAMTFTAAFAWSSAMRGTAANPKHPPMNEQFSTSGRKHPR